MRCAECQHDDGPGRAFCSQCGAPLGRGCARCGFQNGVRERCCGGCGSDLEPEAGWRLVAFLVAELADADPARVRLGRRHFLEVAREVARRHQGTFEGALTTRVMVAFAAAAVRDGAERAQRAALALRAASAHAFRKAGISLDLRIGVALDREQALELVQHGDEACAGRTIVSTALAEATLELFEYEKVGELPHEGALRRPPLFRLESKKRTRSREPERAFVGRRKELRQVRALLAGCLEDARGTSICVRGEPGIGKSRLLTEIEAGARSLGFDPLKARVLDFGAGAGAAIKELTLQLLGVKEGDEGARRALERAIDDELVRPELAPFLLEILSVPLLDVERRGLSDLDGRVRAGLRLDAFSELVTNVSERRPLLLTLEDIHWADSVTLAFVTRLISVVEQTCSVLCVATRAEGDPLNEDRGEFIPSAFVRIELGPLRDVEALELLGELGVEDDEAAEQCVSLAAGNPLFLEQLIEAGVAGERLPVTLPSLLRERVRRLPEPDRAALEVASVLGQRFDLHTLSSLLGVPEYDPGELLARRLLRADASCFVFRHELLRDAVYGSLAREHREALHRKAAGYYDGRDAVLHAEHLELGGRPAAPAYLKAAEELVAAYHFERAGRLLEHAMGVTRQPNELYSLAELRGRAAIDFATPEVAADAYERALGAADSDRERCGALIGLALAHRQRSAYDEMLSAVARATALAEEFDWPLERGKLRYLRGSACFALGRPGDSLLEHEAALRLIERVGDAEWKARALRGIGDAHYALAQMTLAEMHFEQAALCCEAHGFERFATPNRLMIALLNLFRGDTRKATAAARRALESNAGALDRNADIMARHLLAMAHLLRGEYEMARREAALSLEVARRSGSRRFDAESLALVAIAEHGLGRTAAAARSAESAVESARAVGLSISGPIALGALAASSQDPETARRALEEGDALLRARPVAHNGFWFSLMALRYAVGARDAALVERHGSWLAELARRDHLAACELAVEAARSALRGPLPATLVTKARALELSLSLVTGSDSAEELLR